MGRGGEEIVRRRANLRRDIESADRVLSFPTFITDRGAQECFLFLCMPTMAKGNLDQISKCNIRKFLHSFVVEVRVCFRKLQEVLCGNHIIRKIDAEQRITHNKYLFRNADSECK